MATFTNQATLSYNNITRNSNIATGEILETVSATKTAVDTNYSNGQNITYVVNIVNSGATDLNGLTVTDNLGAYQTQTATAYPLTYVENTATYFVNGVEQARPAATAGPPLAITGINIPAGANATIVYEANVNGFAPLASGSTIQNTVSVTGAGLAAPVTAVETLPVNIGPDLQIVKSISPAVVTENGRVTYTFTIQNYGNNDATTADNAIITDNFNPVLSDLAVTFNGNTWAENTNYTYTPAGAFATLPNQITVPAATYTQDPTTGQVTVVPGTSTLTVTGTI